MIAGCRPSDLPELFLMKLFAVLDFIIENGTLEDDPRLLLDMLDYIGAQVEGNPKVVAYLEKLKPKFEGTFKTLFNL